MTSNLPEYHLTFSNPPIPVKRKKRKSLNTKSKYHLPLTPDDIALGIDQGYKHLGICLSTGRGIVLFTLTLHFTTKQTKKEKRKQLIEVVTALLPWKPSLIVVEQAREFSTKDGVQFHNKHVIASLREIKQCLVDAFDIPVVSADTRATKNHILGNANISKDETVKIVQLLTNNRGIDEHGADAYCFSQAAFNRNINLLKEE